MVLSTRLYEDARSTKYKNIIISPAVVGEIVTKIIFHSGLSDFGEGNGAEILLQSNIGKMYLLKYILSSTRYERNVFY